MGEWEPKRCTSSRGHPWENCCNESFGGKLWDNLLGRDIFYTLLELRVRTELCRQTCNRARPHSAQALYLSLGYGLPVPEVLMPADPVPMLVEVTRQRAQLTGASQRESICPRFTQT